MRKNQKIDQLIDNYLSGKLNDWECTILNEWLKEKKNVSYYNNYCANWEPFFDESFEENWNNLKSERQLREQAAEYRLGSNISSGTGPLRIMNIRLMKYAAVFVIGVLGTLLIKDQLSEIWKSDHKAHWVHAETVSGQKAKIILPDSSVVWLNSETILSFPSDFLAQKNRIVKLDGEGFFEVKDQKRNNFIVRSHDYDILVKGTRFNVMAYKDFNRTETTLVEGSITVLRGKEKLQVNPGERVIYSRNYLTKSKAQVRQSTLWKENKFYFDNVPFKELVRRLERWYDVKITLRDESFNDVYYSGYFKNEETIWQVLDVIKMTTPIKYERKQFRVISINRK